MRSKLRFVRVGFGCVAIAALLAACGSSGTTGAVASNSEIAGSPEATGVVESTDGLAQYDSPISDLLGFDANSYQDIDYEQAERDRQAWVQQCMQDQGFEYVPAGTSSVTMAIAPSQDSGIEYGTRAYAEKYGYGISTTFLDQIALGVSSVEQTVEDPNQALQDAMSESERTAWQAALWGNQPEIYTVVDESGEPLNPDTGEPFTEEEMQAFWDAYQPDGCENQSFTGSQFGEPEGTKRISAFYEEFSDLISDLDDLTMNDPRILAFTDAWVRCMADKSYPFSAQPDVFDEIYKRMDPINAEVYGDGSTFFSDLGVTEEDFNAMTPAEQADLTRDYQPKAPEVSAETQEKLDEVMKYERDVAVADFDCSAGGEELFQTVRKEAEEQFIADNQGAITAFLESHPGG